MTNITLWNGRRIPRIGLGFWAAGGPFFAGETLPKADIRASDNSWLDYFQNGKVAPAAWDKMDAVRDLLMSDGRTLTQGAIAWIWAQNPLTVPLPGFKSEAQIADTLGALETGPLSASVMAEIEHILPSKSRNRPAKSR